MSSEKWGDAADPGVLPHPRAAWLALSVLQVGRVRVRDDRALLKVPFRKTEKKGRMCPWLFQAPELVSAQVSRPTV